MGIDGREIVSRIDSIRTSKKLTRDDIYSACKISKNSLSNWSSRGTIPAADIAIEIAEYLGVSVEWLITGHEKPGLTAEERHLVDRFRLLDSRDRDDILGIIDGKIERSTSRAGTTAESTLTG